MVYRVESIDYRQKNFTVILDDKLVWDWQQSGKIVDKLIDKIIEEEKLYSMAMVILKDALGNEIGISLVNA
jgi:hypothetical protein